LSAVDELAVGDGWPGGRSAEQEIGQIGDASAAIETSQAPLSSESTKFPVFPS
jgi:hypothetical protein